jgi:hypothetical protein
MIKQTYHKVLNAVVNELLHPLLAVLILPPSTNPDQKYGWVEGSSLYLSLNWLL